MSAESDLAPVLHIERELRHLSVELTQPKPGECLHCYVYRMLESAAPVFAGPRAIAT
jgi:hypothetical protein